MQRVRIGLTGLAFVFIFVLLAAIFTRPSDEERITANMIELNRMAGGTPENEVQATEPLAELGVVPGNADNVSAPAPLPAER